MKSQHIFPLEIPAQPWLIYASLSLPVFLLPRVPMELGLMDGKAWKETNAASAPESSHVSGASEFQKTDSVKTDWRIMLECAR